MIRLFQQPPDVSVISGRSKKLAEWTGKIFGLEKYSKQQKQITGNGSFDRLKDSLTELSRQIRFKNRKLVKT